MITKRKILLHTCVLTHTVSCPPKQVLEGRISSARSILDDVKEQVDAVLEKFGGALDEVQKRVPDVIATRDDAVAKGMRYWEPAYKVRCVTRKEAHRLVNKLHACVCELILLYLTRPSFVLTAKIPDSTGLAGRVRIPHPPASAAGCPPFQPWWTCRIYLPSAVLAGCVDGAGCCVSGVRT